MFWKFFEFVIRIIYFRRFRTVKRIGDAGKLLTDGKPEEALALLEMIGERLHQTLLPIYAFTRGKILDALHRTSEAEEAFRLVVLTDPANSKADLELAILTGRRCDFEQCEQWLNRLEEKGDDELAEQASGIRELMQSCASGDRAKEFEQRARKLGLQAIGPEERAPGLPPDLSIIDGWIDDRPEEAREQLDEIALLIGQGLVANGSAWRISLSLDESVVVRKDGFTFNPFRLVGERFAKPDGSLSRSMKDAWSPPDESDNDYE